MSDVSEFSELREDLVVLGCAVEACGSRVTCREVPAGSDYDYLVEAHQGAISDIVLLLSQAGWNWEGHSEHYQSVASSDFMSWRREDVNLIITANAEFARRHRAATKVCTRLNLMDKADRIALFQAVLYGNEWNDKSKKPVPVAKAAEPVF